MASRARRVVLLLGAAAGVMALAVLPFAWNEVVVLSHVRRLRTEPGYLLETIVKPEGTSERQAVRRFFGGAGGPDVYLNLLCDVEPRRGIPVEEPGGVAYVFPPAREPCGLEEGQRTALYQCLVDLAREIEGRPAWLREYDHLEFRLPVPGSTLEGETPPRRSGLVFQVQGGARPARAPAPLSPPAVP